MKQSQPIFKEVTSADKAVWIQFRKTLYHGVDDTFHEKEVDLILNDPTKTTFLIFEKNGDFPVGMLELSLRNVVDGCLTSPVGYIEGIYLDESTRGLGFGKAMVDFSKEWARSKGCSELACDAELHETEAQKFHEKMGFKETYRIVQYKMEV